MQSLFVEPKSHFLIQPNLGLGIPFTNSLSFPILFPFTFPSSDNFSLSLADYDNYSSIFFSPNDQPLPKETCFHFPGKNPLPFFSPNLLSYISFLVRFVAEFQFPRVSRSIHPQLRFGIIGFSPFFFFIFFNVIVWVVVIEVLIGYTRGCDL